MIKLKKEMKKIVPDTSVLIDRILSELIEKGEMKNVEMIIPAAVLDELQSQASRGKEHGFIGLEELKSLRELAKEEDRNIKLRFTGKRPSLEDIKLAKSGRMDAIIRDVAKQEDAEFYTADYVQGLVGEAEGINTHYIPKEEISELRFKDYFTDDTISVHLKEGATPMAKRGNPGEFKLLEIGEDVLTRDDMENIIKEINDASYKNDQSSIEINRRGAMVIQLEDYRIAIARPPFSDGLEVTIVRPIVKLSLEDYRLSEKLMDRLKNRAEGVLIAGPPGSGKTTLASGIAEFYMNEGKIVKTLESPRDLQVGPKITQYGPLEGSFEKTADILLLVRPDYSIFDEVRKPNEFRVFSDMRLAGVGMIGVVHASKAIDAIQRFIGKIELGMIPHVIDTIIFVKAGEVKKVYDVSMIVKVPTGMSESDLSRPIVEVKNFETGKPEYEIYTFGEENVVIEIDKQIKEESGIKKLAKETIEREIKRFDPNPKIEILDENNAKIYVDNEKIPRIIGKSGSMVNKLQEKLGIHLDIEPKVPALGKEIDYEIEEIGNSIELKFKKKFSGKSVNIYLEDEFLLSGIIGKNNRIKISKNSDIGKKFVKAVSNGKSPKIFV